jgi:hypothetical protein
MEFWLSLRSENEPASNSLLFCRYLSSGGPGTGLSGSSRTTDGRIAPSAEGRDKGKPAERRGRKATRLTPTAH